MAEVNVSVDLPETPQRAWDKASTLSRFDEWMTIHGGWVKPPPQSLAVGTEVESLVKVKGFRNTIKWTITEYKEPKLIELSGKGRGGIRISLTMKIVSRKAGSVLALDASFGGGVLFGPVGSVVARALKTDIKKSVENLASMS